MIINKDDQNMVFNHVPFDVWYNHKGDFIWLKIDDANGTSYYVPLPHYIRPRIAEKPEQNFGNTYLGKL